MVPAGDCSVALVLVCCRVAGVGVADVNEAPAEMTIRGYSVSIDLYIYHCNQSINQSMTSRTVPVSFAKVCPF